MSDDVSELPNSRILLQKQAMGRVQEAVGVLNEALASAANLGLRADVSVHVKKRDAHRTPDGTMDDISVAPGDAESRSVDVAFGIPHPPASVTAMRRS